MEDASTTDATLRVYSRLRERFDDVGLVLQARLKRTPRDIEQLGERPCDVRVVKGVYLEPPEIAHTDAQAIRQAFVDACAQLFERGHRVAFATHDDLLAESLLALVRERGVAPERHWFEVLMGVRPRLWKQWLEQGERVRVYVPYGSRWRQYSQRRLHSNPEMLGHVMRSALGLGR